MTDTEEEINRLLNILGMDQKDVRRVEHEVYEHSYNIARAAIVLCLERTEDLEISPLVAVAMLHRLTIHALRDLEKENRKKIRNFFGATGRPVTNKLVTDLHREIMRRISDVTDHQFKRNA